MAIYKLGDLLEKKNGELESKKTGIYLKTGYPVVSAGVSIKGYLSVFNRTGKHICISQSGANAGHVTIMRTPFFAADCFTLTPKVNSVLFDYIALFFEKSGSRISATSEGSAQPHVYWKNISSWFIDLPTLKEQQKIIDIIEPIEKLCESIRLLTEKTEIFVKHLNSKSGYKFGEFVLPTKNKPKKISQVSAKVLGTRTTIIESLENPFTYATNSFYAPRGTILVNTIRTYLEKFGLLFIDADANGTLAIFKPVMFTSALHNLLNDSFWKQANAFSQGTKMPVIKLNDILEIKSQKTQIEIPELLNYFLLLNELFVKSNELREKAIQLLL